MTDGNEHDALADRLLRWSKLPGLPVYAVMDLVDAAYALRRQNVPPSDE